MTTTRTRHARRGLAAALAAALTGLAGIATPAAATASVTTSRVAGADRYATAAAAAAAAYPSGADTVLVASGRSYPDALAGSALAGRQGAPVLLTEPGSLPLATSDAIASLKATKAVILGGTTAVSKAVEDELAKSVTVSRVGGVDRYATAAGIATAIGAANIGSTSSRRAALIATGLGFADALAGGPIAAAGSGGQLPILLVDSGIPGATKDALTDLGIKQTIILGGTAVVSPAVADELQQITGNAPTRLAGTDRYGTAAEVAKAALADFAFDKTKVLLAGTAGTADFPDALAGAPLGGKTKTPILLTAPSSLSSNTQAYLTAHSDDIATITAIGGTAAITDGVLAAAKAAATPKAGTESITVTPADESFLANDGSTSRTYTASDLTETVDIVLVTCDQVNGSTFTNSNTNSIVDGTSSGSSDANDKASTPARISQVNGAPNLSSNDDYADNASPSAGKVTFAVAAPSSPATACVVPVVFIDANGDNALSGSAGNPSTPSETFGMGGKVNFTPAASSGGSFSGLRVQSVHKSGDRFVACTTGTPSTCNTFFYDSGDTYQIESQSSTMAAFEAAISPGDTVSGTYTTGGASTFNLTDSAPTPPSTVTASEASGTTTKQVTVSWPDASSQNVAAYKVYRAAFPSGATIPTTPPLGSVDCSGFADTDYSAITATPIPDPSAPVNSYNDSGVTPGRTYCYKVSSVDASGDEGPLSSSAGGVTVSS